MRTTLAVLGILACFMLVGFIEDPCATEGLMAGCMN
jgi:hypothetical protein